MLAQEDPRARRAEIPASSSIASRGGSTATPICDLCCFVTTEGTTHGEAQARREPSGRLVSPFEDDAADSHPHANHRLVELADTLDWTEMEVRAESIRASKLKNAAGRPPRLRPLLGAMVFRATRYQPYEVLEEQIRHYAPARYLCGLTETNWTPDKNTLHDFIQLMGEEGARFINEYVVERAVEEKLADPKVLIADLTAQEAAIPHPNEIGLMAGFMATVAAASKRAGAVLKQFAEGAASQFEAAKKRAQEQARRRSVRLHCRRRGT